MLSLPSWNLPRCVWGYHSIEPGGPIVPKVIGPVYNPKHMIRRLAVWLGAATLVLVGPCRAADLRGYWIFDPSAQFPQFTTLTVSEQEPLQGAIRSLWYGALPM